MFKAPIVLMLPFKLSREREPDDIYSKNKQLMEYGYG